LSQYVEVAKRLFRIEAGGALWGWSGTSTKYALPSRLGG
jgi:hypothetical protein